MVVCGGRGGWRGQKRGGREEIMERGGDRGVEGAGRRKNSGRKMEDVWNEHEEDRVRVMEF